MTVQRNQQQMRYMVLDTSYFRTCSPEQLLEDGQKGIRFVVPMEVWIEVCTAGEDKAGLLSKLHELADFVDLLDLLNTLYKYEIEKCRPCSPLTDHFLPGRLNPNFSRQFIADRWNVITAESDHMEQWSSDVFLRIIQEVSAKCSNLGELDISNADHVLSVYDRLRVPGSRLPAPHLIDDRWAIYRKVQMDLLAAVDYLRTWSGKAFALKQERKLHDQVDFRVCIIAALMGGLAAEDNNLIQYFRSMCPSGDLIRPPVKAPNQDPITCARS